MNNFITEFLKGLDTNNDIIEVISLKSIFNFAKKKSEDMATFEEFVLYDLLLELKDMLLNKEKYICVYMEFKGLKQLINKIDEVLFHIEAYQEMPDEKKDIKNN